MKHSWFLSVLQRHPWLSFVLVLVPGTALAVKEAATGGFLGGIDAVFGTIVSVLDNFIFFSIGGMPLVVLWLIIGAIFFTLRMKFINIRAFRHAIEVPVREGIVALLEPFIDTIVVSNMTALVIVTTGAYRSSQNDGVRLTFDAFATGISWFPLVLGLAVFLFAFSTILSWGYYGERAWTYLFGENTMTIYRVIYVIFVFIGSVVNLKSVLDFGDMMLQTRKKHVEETLHKRFKGSEYEEVQIGVAIGDPSSEIIDYAKEIDSDLIIIPCHGRTGLSRFLLGSVAERVIRFAHCPVLVLRRCV